MGTSLQRVPEVVARDVDVADVLTAMAVELNLIKFQRLPSHQKGQPCLDIASQDVSENNCIISKFAAR